MSDQDKATPRPWYYSRDEGADNLFISTAEVIICEAYGYDEYGEDLPGEVVNSNARLIVKAVNSHDDLLNALKRVQDEADHALRTEAHNKLEVSQHNLKVINTIVRQAIYKVEGGNHGGEDNG